MADDLSTPLGRRKRGGLKTLAGRLPLARLGFAVVAVLVVGAALRITLVSDPEGGRPAATVPINSTRAENQVAGHVAAPSPPATITAEPEMVVPPGASITTIGDDVPSGLGAPMQALVNKQGVLPELAEDTKNGPIPRMSTSGETPFSAYARPAPQAVAGKAMVAIVVTGLGLNEATTLDAVDRLPPDVSLAFAPYGRTLDKTVAAARAAGHELLLEVPLEPFDYPETDPGPQTLLTGQPARRNIDKLYWLMARFGGYVGLINHTGARFTASASDFGPVMEELGTRGLGYLDDGTSNRSIAPELARANKVPFARADAMLDADPSKAAILAALDALASRAASTGSAIGVVSALPVSIATVTEWADGLGDRNVQLVPASALMK